MRSYETILSAWHKTLMYSNIFDYPLTKDEVYSYLLSKRYIPQKDFDEWFHKNTTLLHQRYSNESEYWTLQGRAVLVPSRKKRYQISKKKLSEARLITLPLFILPWIQFIGVTGTVAAYNARQEDDIDILIITRPHRTWVTRFLALTYLSLIRKRFDTRKQQLHNTYCINHLISTDKLESKQQDVYIANEIMRMRPLWERNNSFTRFLGDNSWLSDIVPTWYTMTYKPSASERTKAPEASTFTQHLTFILLAPFRTPFVCMSWLVDISEKFVQKWQIKKAELRSTNADLLTHHIHDNREWILREFDNALR